MDQLKTTKLTAAKICHEIANYLSIMKFLEEDLRPSCHNDDLKMLLDNVDLLTYTMDFFRNLYASSKQKTGVGDVVFNIYKLKGISLIGSEKVFQSFSNPNEESMLACILYIIMKSCRHGDEVSIAFDNNLGVSIEITASIASLPSSILYAINSDDCEEDIFNVLAKYAKQLANLEKYCMSTNDSVPNNLGIKIWKK